MVGRPSFQDGRAYGDPNDRQHSAPGPPSMGQMMGGTHNGSNSVGGGPSSGGHPNQAYFYRPPPPPSSRMGSSVTNGGGGSGVGGGSGGAGTGLGDSRYHSGMPTSAQHSPDEYPSPVHRGMSVRPSPPFRYGSEGSGSGGGLPASSSYDFNYARPFAPAQNEGQWSYDAARRSHHADSVSSTTTSGSNMSMYGPSSVQQSLPPPPPSMMHQGDAGRGIDPYSRPSYGRHSSDGDIPGGGSNLGGSAESSHGAASGSSANATGHAVHGNTSADRKVSCLECRSSKVKCSGQAEGGCDRCKRIKRPCVFEQHRRGRKPAQVKMHKLEQSVDTIISALSALTEYKRNRASEHADDDEGEEDGDEEIESRRPSSAKKRQVKRRAESDSSSYADLRRSIRARIGNADDSTSPADEGLEGKGKGGDRSRLNSFIETVADQARHLRSPNSSNEPTGHSSRDQQSEAGHALVADLEVAVQELGQPPMSNPLKLLAQASDSNLEPASADTIAVTPMRQDWEEAVGDEGVEGAAQPTADASGSTRKDRSKKDEKTRGHTSTGDKQRGASRRGYWSIGMYSTRPDRGPNLDPITKGIMSTYVARDLYELYMRHLNAPITLLDPLLHSFAYVRSHSALLLSASCALAARFASHIENAEEIANKLDAHVQDTLLPAVLLKGYRSAEIAQAFIILAAYHCNTQSLDGDRSWSYVGYGIRIAAELDMNARLLSELSSLGKADQTPNTAHHPDTPASSRAGGGGGSSVGGFSEDGIQISPEEATQRRLRNRERTWCNLWLFEYSLSTHMGRRSTLGQDPVILGVSAGWHRAPYAIKGDEAIVALIGLRRIQIKNAEFFEHSILSNTGNGTGAAHRESDSAALQFQLDFYAKSCRGDINSWTSMYVDERDEGGHSYRMKNASLYASYARLILNSYALKCTADVRLLEPFYQESYSAAMTYLTLYSERIRSPGLTYVHNSSVVTVAYVAVFALKLCSLDTDRYPYIDQRRVFDHVRELVHALTKAGSVTSWRNGAASSYAPYLSAVLERVERNTHLELERRRSSAASQDVKPGTEGKADGAPDSFENEARGVGERGGGSASLTQTLASSYTPPELMTTDNNEHAANNRQSAAGGLAHTTTTTTGQTPGRFPSFSFASGLVPPSSASAASKLQPEALTFIAGPSGVEAATILDDLAVHEDYLRFGAPPHNVQESQFLEGSLFGDMSVFLNASFNDHTNPWPSTMNMGGGHNGSGEMTNS